MPLLLDVETSRRDHDLSVAAGVLAGRLADGHRADEGIPDGPEKELFRSRLRAAEVHDDRLQRLERITEEKRATVAVSIKSEPRTYGPANPENSFFIDVARAALPGMPGAAEAQLRLDRHGKEVAREAMVRSDEGKRALRTATTTAFRSEHPRSATEEALRAMTTGSGSGGSLVTPEYLPQDWAMYRTFPASVTGQATTVPDPGFGMQMNIPAIEASATVAAQSSQNSAVSDSVPTGGYISANLATYAGEVEISQQLLDRSGPGPSFDVLLHEQLGQGLRTAIDTAVITAMLAGATSVTGAATFTAAGLFGDIAAAKSAIATAAGTKLPATGIFVTPAWTEYLLSSVDPAGRPLLLPTSTQAALPIRLGPDGGPPAGFTGDRLLGTALFADENVPPASSDAQFLVAHMPEVFVQTSEPALRTIVETDANILSVVVQLYCYVGVIVRHATAAAVVTGGAAYPATPTFA